MNTRNRLMSLPAAVGIALLGLAVAPASQAATIEHYDYQSAAGVCQGALPAFAGTLRARPLAVGNEGAAVAFVTCALRSDDRGASTARTARTAIRLGNTGASGSVTINCTFVHGFGSPGVVPTYLTRSVVVAAGGSSFVEITPADLDATEVRYAQWSCALPPNAVVYYVNRHYNLEIGD